MFPFTHDAFLDVFASYNTALWPVALVLWVATALVVARWLILRRVSAAATLWLLAAHWGWSAIAYHWAYFRAINPAAIGFAAAFLVQAIIFAVLALRSAPRSRAGGDWRVGAGAALSIYGLAYPLLGVMLGLSYPRMPLFGVPCPTVLITAGLLIGAVQTPGWSVVVPILWCVIGGSAAFLLGIHADLALLVAAAVLTTDQVARRRQPGS